MSKHDAIEADSLVQYVGAASARGLAPATINQHLACLKHLIEFARMRGCVVPERVIKPRIPRVRRALASTMTREEMAVFDDFACGVREPLSAIMRVMPLCGLRVSEVCGLLVSDLIWPTDADGLFVISVTPNAARTVKGRSDRQVVVHHKATDILRHYCFNTYPKLKGFKVGTQWLFPDNKGRPVKRRRVSAAFTAVGRKMGRPLNPHATRHAHATLLSEEGWSVAAIMEQLGHERPETTMQYISMNLEKRRDMMAGIRL